MKCCRTLDDHLFLNHCDDSDGLFSVRLCAFVTLIQTERSAVSAAVRDQNF